MQILTYIVQTPCMVSSSFKNLVDAEASGSVSGQPLFHNRCSQLNEDVHALCSLRSGEVHKMENCRQSVLIIQKARQVFALLLTVPAAPIDEPDGTLQGHYSIQAAGAVQADDAFWKGQNKLNVQQRRMWPERILQSEN